MSADLLRRAAKTLREHVAELPRQLQTNWTQDSSEISTEPGPGDYTREVSPVGSTVHDQGAEVAYYVIMMHPPVAVALAACMDEVARMGELSDDLLHRIGRPELIAVARAILREVSS